ncbi:TIGR01212 family radical SAM protein [Fusobacterium sp. MFO224]|uniref:TIGR01212 family radical SAM protein n=1 Tax=Fusobacterium sp. MFO224 TaxID=3378070 RepID=UPI0038528B82
MNNDRFYSLNNYLKETFGKKVYKVSLDGGFTCPNRDGTISSEGCIFCSDAGSGEFAGSRNKSITEQIEEQLDFIKSKNNDNEVIAYFQNFTNTYADIKYLRKIYFEALSHEKVIGIAIATRPDCVEGEVLELLQEINEKYFLWVELGLQTSNDDIGRIINRGYNTEKYIETANNLKRLNIKFVTHMILSLPNEKKQDLYDTIKLINQVQSWGIKIHMLYILKNSKLEKYYNKELFKIYSEEEYVETVIELIERLDKNIVIHRLTGDPKKEELLIPLWSLNKRKVLNSIHKNLKSKETFQGAKINECNL